MGGQRSGECKASVYLLDSGNEITINVAILAGVDVVSLQASDSQIACRRCVQNVSFEQREHFRLSGFLLIGMSVHHIPHVLVSVKI